MNTISKDQSIITQVAAKIAADLTPKTDDVNTNIANWVLAFDATTEALLTVHGMTGMTEEQAVQAIVENFNGTVVNDPFNPPAQQYVAPQPAPTQFSGGFQVRIKGKQHGPIPAWLNDACAAKGVTEVWDNRDGLAANPKRPWFKAVNGDAAFWEPKARR
jgi:hypothetical protein